MKLTVSSSKGPFGQEHIPPADWATFTGTLPRRGTKEYMKESRWPRYRVLSMKQAGHVLGRHNCGKAAPGKLKKEYIQYYLRNFDSEGKIVDPALTSSFEAHMLPMDSDYAQMMMDMIREEKSKESSGGPTRKAIKFSLSSEAAKSARPTESREDDYSIANKNSTTSTLTISKTATQTITDLASDEDTTAPTEPFTPTSPPFAPTPPLGTPTPPLVAEELGRQLEVQPSEPTSPSSTSKSSPLAVLKRTRELQPLKRENKRLRTENSEKETKLDTQELELARLNRELLEKELEVDRLNESVESLEKALEQKQTDISVLEPQSRGHEEERSKLANKIQELQRAKMVKDADLLQQRERFKNMEHSMASLKEEVENQKSRFEGSERVTKQAFNDKLDLQKQLKEERKENAKLQRKFESVESEKAKMFDELKGKRKRCEKLQEEKDEMYESGKLRQRATARLLCAFNQIYDSLADDETETDEFWDAVKGDLGDEYERLQKYGMYIAKEGI